MLLRQRATNESRWKLPISTRWWVCPSRVWCLPKGLFTVEDLNSTQEEADARISIDFSHAARSGYSTLIVASGDTDVFILWVSFQRLINSIINISQVWNTDKCSRHPHHEYSTSHRSKSVRQSSRYARVYWLRYSECLCWTGKDWSTSNSQRAQILSGNVWPLGSGVGTLWRFISEASRFYLSALHFFCPGANSVNELTFRMFCSRRDNIESEQLPPCADCLYKHACRANYQTAIWRRSLENRLEIQSWKTWLRTRGEQARDWVDGWPSSIDSKFIASLLFMHKIL